MQYIMYCSIFDLKTLLRWFVFHKLFLCTVCSLAICGVLAIGICFSIYTRRDLACGKVNPPPKLENPMRAIPLFAYLCARIVFHFNKRSLNVRSLFSVSVHITSVMLQSSASFWVSACTSDTVCRFSEKLSPWHQVSLLWKGELDRWR